MTRPLLPEDRVDPAIREVIAQNHRDIIDEVERAVVAHDVVVVGMKQNPFPRRARNNFDAGCGEIVGFGQYQLRITAIKQQLKIVDKLFRDEGECARQRRFHSLFRPGKDAVRRRYSEIPSTGRRVTAKPRVSVHGHQFGRVPDRPRGN